MLNVYTYVEAICTTIPRSLAMIARPATTTIARSTWRVATTSNADVCTANGSRLLVRLGSFFREERTFSGPFSSITFFRLRLRTRRQGREDGQGFRRDRSASLECEGQHRVGHRQASDVGPYFLRLYWQRDFRGDHGSGVCVEGREENPGVEPDSSGLSLTVR